jgi:hypothetical protein
VDAIIEIGKVLGLPGLVMMVWYLLERDRQKNAAKAESERTAAMTIGFQSLSGKLDSHAQDDADRHGETREAIVDLRARFDVLHDLTPVGHEVVRRVTPPQGVPVSPGYYAPRRPGTKGDR